jgi:hypothetical protein
MFFCNYSGILPQSRTKEKNETEKRRGGEPEIKTQRFTVSPPLRINLLAFVAWWLNSYESIEYQREILIQGGMLLYGE